MTIERLYSEAEIANTVAIIIRSPRGDVHLASIKPFRDDCMQILLADNIGMELIDEAEMNRMGWYRKEETND